MSEFIFSFQMHVKSEDPDENFNPWIVNNLEEFLFFCCPECDTQSPSKALFINHALIGKSLSEALLFAEQGETMLCTKIVLNVGNNFCTQHVLPRFELGNFMH